MTRPTKNVKTTADVRQTIGGAIVSPQTCDKNKIRFLEVNLDEKKCLKFIGISCVFSILMKSFKKYDFGMRISIGKISRVALLYIISTIRLGQALPVKFDHSSPRFSLQPNYSKSRDRLYESSPSLQATFPAKISGATCMRAVNRQPMFTARGTRRAFSYIFRIRNLCPPMS